MGEAKRSAQVSGKTEEERRAERIKAAEAMGWTAFVSRVAIGGSLTQTDVANGLLGLGRKVDAIFTGAKNGLDAASEVARVHQNRILAVFSRQEVGQDYTRKHDEALKGAFAGVVTRQDADALVFSNYLVDLLAWQLDVKAYLIGVRTYHLEVQRVMADYVDALVGWRALGWWKRRKTSRPALKLPDPPKMPRDAPTLPKLHPPLVIEFPPIPDLPPLMSPAEEAALREDAAPAPKMVEVVEPGPADEASTAAGPTDAVEVDAEEAPAPVSP